MSGIERAVELVRELRDAMPAGWADDQATESKRQRLRDEAAAFLRDAREVEELPGDGQRIKAAADAIRKAQDGFTEDPTVMAEILEAGDVADYLARVATEAYRDTSADGPPLNSGERAELELLRDNQQRLIAFDGGAELMPWVDVHRVHHLEPDEPYIGCPFCRERFVVRDTEREHEPDGPTHRVSWLDGWEAARCDVAANPRGEAEEAWRLAFGDSPGALWEQAVALYEQAVMRLTGELANALAAKQHAEVLAEALSQFFRDVRGLGQLPPSVSESVDALEEEISSAMQALGYPKEAGS